jgi:GAF domain-containing protein
LFPVEETPIPPELDGLGPWSTVEQLVRTLRVPADDADDLLARIVAEAVRIVPATRDAGVIVIDPDRKLRTVSTTGPVPRHLDELQMQLGTGPCLTAARKQIVVRMHDIAADTRWAPYRRAALECEVGSMLCVPLYVDDQTLGTLSLYGDRPDAFREGAEPVARMLAALSAVAVAETRLRARMERALANRDLIGQAKGILMHRHGIRSDEAFEMLRIWSQRTNSKLLAVADRVVETGGLE